MRARLRSAAFTLVELLAVIGIMGLLAVVAVPALKGLTGSGGRKQALGQLIGALELARNTAISSGTNAGVIFPTDSMSIPEYAYRTMAVVTWGTTSTNNEAEMVGDWISLPRGIAFFPGSLAATNLVTATNITYRILTKNITNGTFNAVIFQRDGGLLAGTKRVKLLSNLSLKGCACISIRVGFGPHWGMSHESQGSAPGSCF